MFKWCKLTVDEQVARYGPGGHIAIHPSMPISQRPAPQPPVPDKEK